MYQQSAVSLEDARRMIAGGEAKARDIGQPMDLAIVDNGGNLVAFAHLDGAWKGSVDIAINKAFTSAMFELPTKGLAEKAQPEKPFYGIHVSRWRRASSTRTAFSKCFRSRPARWLRACTGMNGDRWPASAKNPISGLDTIR